GVRIQESEEKKNKICKSGLRPYHSGFWILDSDSCFSPRSSHRFGFDDDIVRACVVAQVAFVDAEKEHAVALRDELSFAADEDKIVVVVTDDGDERARRI